MIHTGDCLEVMATLDAESIDAVVTDPPIEAEARAAVLRELREEVAGLLTPVDTWPDGWDSGIDRVLAAIDRRLGG